MTPDELHTAQSLGGRIGAHLRWANVTDRVAAMAPAKQAFLDRFEREADPGGVLDPIERGIKAEHLKKAYFARLSLRSAQARAATKRRRGVMSDRMSGKDIEVEQLEDPVQDK